MGSFASFIESEAFFTVLILLLMILMFTFVSILMSGKKQEKKKMQERKKIQIDENAQIQLVQHGEKTHNIEHVENKEKEIGGTEVGLVKEVEAAELEEVEEELDTMRITVEESQEIKVTDYTRPIEDMEDEYVVQHQNALEEELNESEIVKVEMTEPTDNSNEIGEEINIPISTPKEEVDEEPIITQDINKNSNSKDAFEMNADEDHTINETVEYEPPQEYDGDKTEILDFPDFGFLDDDSSNNVETKILDQANKYIETIMESRETHEK